MSNNIKKKKKDKKKLKNIKTNENEDLKNIMPNINAVELKSSLQIINSINYDLDTLSNELRYNNIIKQPFSNNINNFKTINNAEYYYDKEDLEMKELLLKTNLLLKNNNFHKQIIKSYEKKLFHSNFNNNNNINDCDSFNYNRKYNTNNNAKFNNNYHLNKNDFVINNKKPEKVNYLNSQFYYQNLPHHSSYNIRKDNINKMKSKKNVLKSSMDKNINKRTKKLENLTLYINDYKRKPVVYSQPGSKRINTNINYRFA